jgi:hypothetical protein
MADGPAVCGSIVKASELEVNVNVICSSDHSIIVNDIMQTNERG